MHKTYNKKVCCAGPEAPREFTRARMYVGRAARDQQQVGDNTGRAAAIYSLFFLLAARREVPYNEREL